MLTEWSLLLHILPPSPCFSTPQELKIIVWFIMLQVMINKWAYANPLPGKKQLDRHLPWEICYLVRQEEAVRKKSMSLLYIELTNWNLRGSLSSQTRKKFPSWHLKSPAVKVKHGSYLSGPRNSSAAIKFLPAPHFRCQSPVHFTALGAIYLWGERDLPKDSSFLSRNCLIFLSYGIQCSTVLGRVPELRSAGRNGAFLEWRWGQSKSQGYVTQIQQAQTKAFNTFLGLENIGLVQDFAW